MPEEKDINARSTEFFTAPDRGEVHESVGNIQESIENSTEYIKPSETESSPALADIITDKPSEAQAETGESIGETSVVEENLNDQLIAVQKSPGAQVLENLLDHELDLKDAHADQEALFDYNQQ